MVRRERMYSEAERLRTSRYVGACRDIIHKVDEDLRAHGGPFCHNYIKAMGDTSGVVPEGKFARFYVECKGWSRAIWGRGWRMDFWDITPAYEGLWVFDSIPQELSTYLCPWREEGACCRRLDESADDIGLILGSPSQQSYRHNPKPIPPDSCLMYVPGSVWAVPCLFEGLGVEGARQLTDITMLRALYRSHLVRSGPVLYVYGDTGDEAPVSLVLDECVSFTFFDLERVLCGPRNRALR